MKTQTLAPRVLGFVLALSLVLPSSSLALRVSQPQDEPRLSGLEKAIKSGMEQGVDRIIPDPLWQGPITSAYQLAQQLAGNTQPAFGEKYQQSLELVQRGGHPNEVISLLLAGIPPQQIQQVFSSPSSVTRVDVARIPKDQWLKPPFGSLETMDIRQSNPDRLAQAARRLVVMIGAGGAGRRFDEALSAAYRSLLDRLGRRSKPTAWVGVSGKSSVVRTLESLTDLAAELGVELDVVIGSSADTSLQLTRDLADNESLIDKNRLHITLEDIQEWPTFDQKTGGTLWTWNDRTQRLEVLKRAGGTFTLLQAAKRGLRRMNRPTEGRDFLFLYGDDPTLSSKDFLYRILTDSDGVDVLSVGIEKLGIRAPPGGTLVLAKMPNGQERPVIVEMTNRTPALDDAEKERGPFFLNTGVMFLSAKADAAVSDVPFNVIPNKSADIQRGPGQPVEEILVTQLEKFLTDLVELVGGVPGMVFKVATVAPERYSATKRYDPKPGQMSVVTADQRIFDQSRAQLMKMLSGRVEIDKKTAYVELGRRFVGLDGAGSLAIRGRIGVDFEPNGIFVRRIAQVEPFEGGILHPIFSPERWRVPGVSVRPDGTLVVDTTVVIDESVFALPAEPTAAGMEAVVLQALFERLQDPLEWRSLLGSPAKWVFSDMDKTAAEGSDEPLSTETREMIREYLRAGGTYGLLTTRDKTTATKRLGPDEVLRGLPPGARQRLKVYGRFGTSELTTLIQQRAKGRYFSMERLEQAILNIASKVTPDYQGRYTGPHDKSLDVGTALVAETDPKIPERNPDMTIMNRGDFGLYELKDVPEEDQASAIITVYEARRKDPIGDDRRPERLGLTDKSSSEYKKAMKEYLKLTDEKKYDPRPQMIPLLAREFPDAKITSTGFGSLNLTWITKADLIDYLVATGVPREKMAFLDDEGGRDGTGREALERVSGMGGKAVLVGKPVADLPKEVIQAARRGPAAHNRFLEIQTARLRDNPVRVASDRELELLMDAIEKRHPQALEVLEMIRLHHPADLAALQRIASQRKVSLPLAGSLEEQERRWSEALESRGLQPSVARLVAAMHQVLALRAMPEQERQGWLSQQSSQFRLLVEGEFGLIRDLFDALVNHLRAAPGLNPSVRKFYQARSAEELWAIYQERTPTLEALRLKETYPEFESRPVEELETQLRRLNRREQEAATGQIPGDEDLAKLIPVLIAQQRLMGIMQDPPGSEHQKTLGDSGLKIQLNERRQGTLSPPKEADSYHSRLSEPLLLQQGEPSVGWRQYRIHGNIFPLLRGQLVIVNNTQIGTRVISGEPRAIYPGQLMDRTTAEDMLDLVAALPGYRIFYNHARLAGTDPADGAHYVHWGASVRHHHHLQGVPFALPVESFEVEQVAQVGPIRLGRVTGYPARVLVLESENKFELARWTDKAAQWLDPPGKFDPKTGLGFNVLMTPGPEGRFRVYIFPRSRYLSSHAFQTPGPVLGQFGINWPQPSKPKKGYLSVSPATVEMAGFLVTVDPETYERMTPEIAGQILDEVSIPEQVFAGLTNAIQAGMEEQAEKLTWKVWWATLGYWGPVRVALRRFSEQDQAKLLGRIRGVVSQLAAEEWSRAQMLLGAIPKTTQDLNADQMRLVLGLFMPMHISANYYPKIVYPDITLKEAIQWVKTVAPNELPEVLVSADRLVVGRVEGLDSFFWPGLPFARRFSGDSASFLRNVRTIEEFMLRVEKKGGHSQEFISSVYHSERNFTRVPEILGRLLQTLEDAVTVWREEEFYGAIPNRMVWDSISAALSLSSTPEDLRDNLQIAEEFLKQLREIPTIQWGNELVGTLANKAIGIRKNGMSFKIVVTPETGHYESHQVLVSHAPRTWDNPDGYPADYGTEEIYVRDTPWAINVVPDGPYTPSQAGAEEQAVNLTWRAWWATLGSKRNAYDVLRKFPQPDQATFLGKIHGLVNQQVDLGLDSRATLVIGIPLAADALTQKQFSDALSFLFNLGAQQGFLWQGVSRAELSKWVEEVLRLRQQGLGYRLKVTPRQGHMEEIIEETYDSTVTPDAIQGGYDPRGSVVTGHKFVEDIPQKIEVLPGEDLPPPLQAHAGLEEGGKFHLIRLVPVVRNNMTSAKRPVSAMKFIVDTHQKGDPEVLRFAQWGVLLARAGFPIRFAGVATPQELFDAQRQMPDDSSRSMLADYIKTYDPAEQESYEKALGLAKAMVFEDPRQFHPEMVITRVEPAFVKWFLDELDRLGIRSLFAPDLRDRIEATLTAA